MPADTAYVGDQIGIRSTTDTVEQVKEALGPVTGIRIDNSETEEEKPSVETEAVDGSTAADETETEEETEEEKEAREAAEAEAAEEKKAKKAMPLVPRARLNEEIRKRKELERQLAEKDDEPETVKSAAETRPQTYCGRVKPTIDVFTADPTKYPDPYAAHAEAVGEWFADERDAKREFEGRVTAAAKAREEETALFKATIPETLKRRPDYNDVVNGSDVQVSTLMEKFCYESEIGPDLLLYLVENPDEAERVRNMRPRAQSAEMFALEATLMEEFGIEDEDDEEVVPPPKKAVVPPPKKTVSKAPLPASRIKSVGPQPKTLQDLAGTTDRESGRVEYNPAYTQAVKARRGT